jgi:hypothetical protein
MQHLEEEVPQDLIQVTNRHSWHTRLIDRLLETWFWYSL